MVGTNAAPTLEAVGFADNAAARGIWVDGAFLNPV